MPLSGGAVTKVTSEMIYIESATEPASPRVGMIWYDTVNETFKVCKSV